MSRIYRSVWNEHTATYVVVAENTKKCGAAFVEAGQRLIKI
ncbi:MAG: ESPR domain-containing protein [Alcaligenes pakistanensis]|nr:hypothetical protein [Alcaligenes faecalis]